MDKITINEITPEEIEINETPETIEVKEVFVKETKVVTIEKIVKEKGLRGDDGEDGKDGKDGKTPTKTELKKFIKEMFPEDKLLEKLIKKMPKEEVESIEIGEDQGGQWISKNGKKMYIKRVSNIGAGMSTGVYNFIQLLDTPSSYVGQSGKVVKVKSDETGLEFAVSGGGLSSFTSPDDSITIGGTLTDPTVDINLGHENTFTVGQVFNDADVTKIPLAPATSSATFVLDAGGILANNSAYQYYIYSYYYTGTTYAYDNLGIFTAPNPPTGIDPGDGLLYKQNLIWAAGSDANGYIILNFMTGEWLDVGNVNAYSISAGTVWNSAGSFPSLSPTSLVEPGHPIWANKGSDWGTTDFNVWAAGLSGSNHLQMRWYYAGGSGAGALRFESDDGILKQINANIYGLNATFTSGATIGALSTTTTNVSSISTKQIIYSNSGALSGDVGFEYDSTNNRLLLSNNSITATSKLHLNESGATAIYTQYTNSATGVTPTDGYFHGISTTGVAELRQRENLPIEFYTNNTKRIETLAGGNTGFGTAGTVNAKVDILSTTEQLRLLYNASNSVQFTVSSGGLLSLQTTAGATAGIYTLTPHGAGGIGTNRTLSFGNGYNNPAIYLYDGGSAGQRFGWGMRSDSMQFFVTDTAGATFTWNRGGDMQATGTKELMRLTEYAAGTGAGLGLGNDGYAATTPYRIDLLGVSATTGTAGVEDIIRFARAQTGGVSYPEAFTIGLGRYSSSGTGPDTRVDFRVKSTAATNYTADAGVMTLNSNHRVMIGDVGTPATAAHIVAATGDKQLRLERTATIYCDIDVADTTGVVTFDSVGGSTPGFTFADSVTMNDAKDFVLQTTTGSKIGTATGQKLAFHNSTPVIQRAGAAQVAVATTAATNVAPYGFTTAAQADALVTLVNELRAALTEKGLIKGAA